jgi:CheY-like chemotaxis protein
VSSCLQTTHWQQRRLILFFVNRLFPKEVEWHCGFIGGILAVDAQYLRHRISELRRQAAVLTRNRLMPQDAAALCTADILDKRSPTAPLVLIVEDDHDVRMLFVTVIKQLGYRVAGASNRSAGAELMRVLRPDLVVADVHLRDGDGDDLAKLARTMNIPILLVSGEPTAIRDHQDGGIPFLQKPFHMSELQVVVVAMVGKPPLQS